MNQNFKNPGINSTDVINNIIKLKYNILLFQIHILFF